MTLILLGAGQYGMMAKEIAEETGIFSKIEFLDDNSELAIGKLTDIDKVEYDFSFVAIGNPNVRNRLLEQIPQTKIATLIHPKAIVMTSAKVGLGSIIEAGAVICSNAEIGKGTIVMANAVVGHDAKVGDCCQLKYNCSISERCIVPNKSIVDCNAVYQDSKKLMN